VLVIALMAVGTLLLGLAPTYAQVGVLGPVILVVARARQGFSVGGEFANSSTFMIEYAPRGRRGRYGGWQMFSQMSGVLAGAVAAGVLTLLLDADALCTWGWRVVIPLVLLVLAGVGVLAIERASARACGCRW
jgi:MFS transporter, MHS family, proline/betaine transporter